MGVTFLKLYQHPWDEDLLIKMGKCSKYKEKFMQNEFCLDRNSLDKTYLADK